MATLLRTATPFDYDAILRHIDDSFGFAPGSFLRDSPHHWRPEFMDWAHILLAEDEGRIAALVRIFSLDLVQNGAVLRAGGIGAVSTATWARGRRHMTHLLEWAVRMMREEGFVVSLLWGDRHRYGAFGFESAGRILQVSINERGLQRAGIAARAPVAFQGQSALLLRITALYETNPYRRQRATCEAPWIYGSPYFEV
jgi:predicted N-acetyltransferase YhbS